MPSSVSPSTQISPWLARFHDRIPRGGLVLDLACGGGRHTRFLLGQGFRVVAVDIDTHGIADLEGQESIEIVTADLEGGAWPFPGRCFDGIVVTNYLHRPLLAHLAGALADGGVLIYETFADGNQRFGRPRNPDYLLRPNELLEAFAKTLFVIAYEHLAVEEPRPAVRQRICARAIRP